MTRYRFAGLYVVGVALLVAVANHLVTPTLAATLFVAAVALLLAIPGGAPIRAQPDRTRRSRRTGRPVGSTDRYRAGE